MKKNIHPEYHPLKVTRTDGSTFDTFSTSKIGKIKLDIDPLVHPAWIKKNNAIVEGYTSINKFKKKFGNSIFNMARVEESADKAEENKTKS